MTLLFLATVGCFLGMTRWMLHRVESEVAWTVRAADLHGRALTLAESDATVQEWLGRPLSAGPLTVEAHGRTAHGGRVDFHFPVRGPHGSGQLHVAALQSPEGWQLEEVVLTCDAGTRVLLAPPEPAPLPSE